MQADRLKDSHVGGYDEMAVFDAVFLWQEITNRLKRLVGTEYDDDGVGDGGTGNEGVPAESPILESYVGRERIYGDLFQKSENDNHRQKLHRSYWNRCFLRKPYLQYSDVDYPFQPPCMLADGSFSYMYSHVLMALLLNNILKSICHPLVVLNVLCMGHNFNTEDAWWGHENEKPNNEQMISICNRILQYICDSQAFQALPRSCEFERGVLRTVVWLCRYKHVFALGWDVRVNESGEKVGEVFVLDCIQPDFFIERLAEALSSRLVGFYGLKHININTHSIMKRNTLGVSGDLKCVPFMARSTMYISMLYLLKESEHFPYFTGVMDSGTERLLYVVFEKQLLDFTVEIVGGRAEEIKKRTDRGELLWLTDKVTTEKILNIDDVALLTVNPYTCEIVGRYVFNGFETGFVKLNGMAEVTDHPVGPSCPVCARFPTTLSLVKECLCLVNALKARFRRT